MQQYLAINKPVSSNGPHRKVGSIKTCPKCRKELVPRIRKKEFQDDTEEATVYWRHKQGDAYLCRNQKQEKAK